MNLSHDDLQTLVQFSNLLNLLSSPDKIQTAVASAAKILDETKELLGPAATKEGADAYKAKVEKDAEALLKSLTNERHEFEALKQHWNNEVDKKNVELINKQVQLTNKETLLVDWEADIKKRKEVLEADEVKAYKIAERLEQRAKSLVEQETALQEKQDQLKKLLG